MRPQTHQNGYSSNDWQYQMLMRITGTYTVGGNISWYNHFENLFRDIYAVSKYICILCDPGSPLFHLYFHSPKKFISLHILEERCKRLISLGVHGGDQIFDRKHEEIKKLWSSFLVLLLFSWETLSKKALWRNVFQALNHPEALILNSGSTSKTLLFSCLAVWIWANSLTSLGLTYRRGTMVRLKWDNQMATWWTR